MVTLRLFHVSDPFRPIESRTLSAEAIRIGRDPGVDWPIEDAACELSRHHCTLRISEGGVSLRDVSANGVFAGAGRRRLPRDADTIIDPEQPIYLGQFMITVETAPQVANDHEPSPGRALDAPFHAPMLQEPHLTADDLLVREGWDGHTPAASRTQLPDAAFLEAFCEGAGLDPSAFMGEDVADVARRAGAVYRQAVIGLSDLMGERSSLKSAFEMNRTTVSAAGNNPFKWADAHQIALDLLRAGNKPFLADEAAIRASFQDLKKHLLCLMAGSRAAVAAAFEAVSPESVESETERGALFKAESHWRAYRKRHAAIVAEAHQDAQGVVNQAFKAGYERHVRKLDGLGTIS